MSLFSFFEFEEKTDPKLKTAAVLSFLASFGAAGWIASVMNFSISELKLNAIDFGLILSVNETAVIFGFIISFLIAYVSESRLLGILVAMAGTSILLFSFSGFEIPIFNVLYSVTGNINPLTVNMAVFAFFLSLSIEYFEKTRDSLVKHSTDSSKTALTMSKISAYCLLGTAFGYFLVTFLGFFSFKYFYFVLYGTLGIPLIVVGILSSKKTLATKSLKENVEIIIRGKFSNFYILTFLTSSINIIMIYFGAFFLVYKFELSLGFVGLIFMLHSALMFFLRRKATEIIKNTGEDLTMKIRYFLTILFFATLIISSLDVIGKDSFMKYALLSILSLYGTTTLFDTSIKSFISYFATPNEQRSNMLIYNRIIQFSKIIIPVLSGLLWIKYGPSSVFGLGAVFSAICLLISFKIYSAYKDGGSNEGEEE